MSIKNSNQFDELMPYEKLELYGEKALKIYELLAIIIKTGTKNKTALDISKEILQLGNNEKNLNFLSDISLEELRTIQGIGRVKAIQIKAVLEFSKRIYKNYGISKTQVKSTTDVITLFMDEMRYEKQEILKLLILNTKNEIIKILDVCKGNSSSIKFDIKTILAEPIKLQAERIILIHNHPNGDPTPSNEDIKTTKKIKESANFMGIQLLEHIIIGNGTYTSIH